MITKRATAMPQDEEWLILAEEAAHEKDLNKFVEIIEALNCALDEHERHKIMARRSRRNKDSASAKTFLPSIPKPPPSLPRQVTTRSEHPSSRGIPC